MARSRSQARRSNNAGRGGQKPNDEGAKFEAKAPDQKPGFDDLNDTKYAKKQEKLSKLNLRAADLKEFEEDPEMAEMLESLAVSTLLH